MVIGVLLYGSGLRLEECLELRVKDIDFDRRQVVVRRGKGQKDRVTLLPTAVVEPLRRHLADVRRLHVADLEAGFGRPTRRVRTKYPNADHEWADVLSRGALGVKSPADRLVTVPRGQLAAPPRSSNEGH